ncbi:oxygen-insensitive NAD(P)H nitroreductase [Pseudoalteromonas fenneropenaei]|uniref:Oxygen-insensitive NAD(P)H nitroreductase n=1 Tax=Pseudoalteromonas fenneropenaei TaxID=1737459 RepID=A0ABV7CFZ5_9GAMM
MITLAEALNSRYATKAFDPTKKIPANEFALLKQALRLSPSSTNAQPWHFVLASDEAGKQRIAKSTQDNYAFNERKVLDASHVVVFCGKNTVDDAHLSKVLSKETADGRFAAGSEMAAKMDAGRRYFVGLNQSSEASLQSWVDKQVYLNVGNFLLSAALLEIDAVPIEGFDATILNEELGLTELGLHAQVIVALGYRSADDFNATLPKSRLAPEQIFTEL